MNELDRLKQQFIDEIKCGRPDEAARTLAKRDELLLNELVSVSEIARMFGITQSAVSNWTSRHTDFPEPVIGERRSARYARSEVLKWWIARHPELVATIREATS